MRIPKLRGFKNRGKVDYEIVNVGDIAARLDAGAFAEAGSAPKKGEQLTINADILRAVGLVRTLNKPMKILGAGDLSVPLFVVADAFSASARSKIEAAGGSVNVLEVPSKPSRALGVTAEADASATESPAAKAPVAEAPEAATKTEPKPTKTKASSAKASTKSASTEPASSETASSATAPKASKASTTKAPKAPKASAAKDEDVSVDADKAPVVETEGTVEASDTDAPATEADAETPSGDDA
jgi:hypothetical protein